MDELLKSLQELPRGLEVGVAYAEVGHGVAAVYLSQARAFFEHLSYPRGALRGFSDLLRYRHEGLRSRNWVTRRAADAAFWSLACHPTLFRQALPGGAHRAHLVY